ncbi:MULTISPECIES: phage major tail protein, TP901-1 family [Bacillus subtilis group]|uniref:phage major tail protein, TP901-1 family n=1 Tax=Bacillus subtilis group TaxID=653685 RepID=UPI000DF79C70|nr:MULTISPECIES: phage major tail protein, TP901-1 family [Bacillus subtilis group]MCY8805771.1 phage major tail protein, TP901-1 family [Bacillus spizizenii]MBG8574004.1 tail protein [Bacillus subtilis]MCY9082410.1 phage major tail protein, TP901-1 family [Bacillus inaquosorum]MDQ4709416.1 phage major tail protein, TP901-1 family [Bacillus subtilis]QAT44830.1 phage major tail protein, TP901-1 family [Bacillus subtilis]
MPELLNGKDEIYFVQPMDAQGTEGLFIAFQTEGSHTKEQDTLDESTKSGRIVGYGTKNESFELTYYAAVSDPGQEAIEDAYDNEKAIKVWKVNKNKNKNDKHNAVYGHAIIESLEFSQPQDGFVEVSITLPVLGKTFKGELPPLPDSVLAAIESSAGATKFEDFGSTTTP